MSSQSSPADLLAVLGSDFQHYAAILNQASYRHGPWFSDLVIDKEKEQSK